MPFRLQPQGPYRGRRYNTLGLNADGSATARRIDEPPASPDSNTTQYRQEARLARYCDVSLTVQAYETSGSLQGASGRYRCDSATAPAADACTVQNNGASFTFAGEWKCLHPIERHGADRRPGCRVHVVRGVGPADREACRAAGTADRIVGGSSKARWEWHDGAMSVPAWLRPPGRRPIQGPAAGRYAVYEPDTGDSGIGSFTASATLQADFDAARTRSPGRSRGSATIRAGRSPSSGRDIDRGSHRGRCRW